MYILDNAVSGLFHASHITGNPSDTFSSQAPTPFDALGLFLGHLLHSVSE